jgi:6-phosphogluconolactonase
MPWQEHLHHDPAALARALADALADALFDALAARGQAWLALAGGRTPLPAYVLLAAMDLDWRRVTLVPTDERCVPHAHPDCNLRALQEAFAAAPGVVIESLTTADGDPARSLAHARARLAPRHAQPFDAVVLGMGNDAHTASLFPGAADLAPALDPRGDLDACRILPDPLPPEAPFERISLTAARLLRARQQLLAITGEGKAAVLRRAQAGADPAVMPIAAILGAAAPHAANQAAVQIHRSP